MQCLQVYTWINFIELCATALKCEWPVVQVEFAVKTAVSINGNYYDKELRKLYWWMTVVILYFINNNVYTIDFDSEYEYIHTCTIHIYSWTTFLAEMSIQAFVPCLGDKQPYYDIQQFLYIKLRNRKIMYLLNMNSNISLSTVFTYRWCYI